MSKTIVITTVPSRQTVPRTVTVNTQNINMDDYEDGTGPRKRRRLTNLTPEEKMLRRKLKNRVAAQTARDRKKALMSDLEIKVAELMEENKKLLRENVNLKSKSDTLSVENIELKERLGLVDGSLVKTETESLGSAAPLVPLPQGQTQALFCSMMPYTATVLMMSFLMCLIKTAPTQEALSGKLKSQNHILNIKKEPQEQNRMLQWWGPQQKSWNPSMNL